jgi:hypothetical protein
MQRAKRDGNSTFWKPSSKHKETASSCTILTVTEKNDQEKKWEKKIGESLNLMGRKVEVDSSSGNSSINCI